MHLKTIRSGAKKYYTPPSISYLLPSPTSALHTNSDYFFPLSEFLCKFLMAAQNFPIFMSSFCIGAIACDRFRFIVQPTRKQMTAKQVSQSRYSYLPACLIVCFP